jgi:hypothetical protein
MSLRLLLVLLTLLLSMHVLWLLPLLVLLLVPLPLLLLRLLYGLRGPWQLLVCAAYSTHAQSTQVIESLLLWGRTRMLTCNRHVKGKRGVISISM